MIITYKYFLCNSEILPLQHAQVSLQNIEYAYGFGVYENVRLSKGKINFLDEHIERLLKSARLIELEHGFTNEAIAAGLDQLVKSNQAESCNLKIMLIGATAPAAAKLYAFCVNPIFPDRKLYRDGAHCITYRYERFIPQAKTLNMLPSYLAYREAKRAGGYDALLIDRRGYITEGTRTNFFAITDRTIYSPPEKDILAGVTRDHVLKVAVESGFEITETDLKLDDLMQFDGAFLTSTSSKIMPVRSIDQTRWPEVPLAVRDLMLAFDKFLAN